jgi:tetratricopeptide (TPR) repeat protein
MLHQSFLLPAFQRTHLHRALVAVIAVVMLAGCEMRGATDYLISGNEAFQRDDYKQAESDYRNALKMEPNSSTALNNLGVILNELGKYDEAAAFLKRAVEVDEKNAIAHYALSQSFVNLGQYDDAVAQARTAVTLAADDMGGHRALAKALLFRARHNNSSDDLKAAAEEFHMILQADQDDERAHAGLAEVLMMQGDKDTAVGEATKSVELNPDNASARKLLARLLHDQGHNDEALKQVDVVLQKNTGDPEAAELRKQIQGG